MSQDLHDNVCQEEIYSKVYYRHAENLRNFLYFKFGNQFEVTDKIQEAFIKLWQKCADVPPSKAKSFLFTVANNLMINEAKHQQVVFKYKNSRTPKNNKQDPQYQLEEQEYLEKYKTALAQLTAKQRTAFMLNRVEGKSFKETAAVLDITIKAVEKRVYGGLKKMREIIKEIP